MRYGYREERKYIEETRPNSYLELSPPPVNQGTAEVKWWRISDISSFLVWYKRPCKYIIHEVLNEGEVQTPPWKDDYVNFIKLADRKSMYEYYYVMTNKGYI
jgi:hypothetical protein